jgi:hypothetical protein
VVFKYKKEYICWKRTPNVNKVHKNTPSSQKFDLKQDFPRSKIIMFDLKQDFPRSIIIMFDQKGRCMVMTKSFNKQI